MNIIPVTITETGEATTVSLADGKSVRVPLATAASEAGKQASFGVRPEDLTVTTEGEFLFEGKIAIAEALGEVTLLYLEGIGDQEPVIAKMPGIFKARKGDVVRLSAPLEKLHLFDSEGKTYRR